MGTKEKFLVGAMHQGVIFDAVIPHPGKYPIVDHNMRDMMIGAAGELRVTP